MDAHTACLYTYIYICVYIQYGVFSLDLVARTCAAHLSGPEMLFNKRVVGEGVVTLSLDSVWGAWAQPDAAERDLQRVGAGTETSDDGESHYSHTPVYATAGLQLALGLSNVLQSQAPCV